MDQLKSFWKSRNQQVWSFFCPLCRAARRIAHPPRPETFTNIARIGLTALVFTLASWRVFGAKGLLSFVPLWTAFEIYYRLRMRAQLRCQQCGFDPVLYQVDVVQARTEVESFWKKKFEDRGIPYPPTKSP